MFSPGRLLLLLASLFSAVGLILLLYVKLTGLDRDEAPPDLSDLIEPFVWPDDTDNAWYWRQLALIHLQQRLDATTLAALGKAFGSASSRDDFDRDAILLAADLPGLLALLERARLAPFNADPDILLDSGEDPDPIRLDVIIHLLLLQARQQNERDEPDDALAHQLLALRETRALAQAKTHLVNYYLAASASRRVLADIRETSLHHQPTPASLHQALLVLLTAAPSPEEARLLIVAELEAFRRMLNEAEREVGLGFTGIHLSPLQQLFYGTRLLFKPNRTLRIRADQTRHALAQSTLPQDALIELPELTDEMIRQLDRPMRLRDPENIIGRLLLSLFRARERHSIDIHHSQLSAHALTTTTLALRLYRLEQERWPDTLDDLVPNLLPFVPRDPSDHAPLRYDSETGILWSRLADSDSDPAAPHRVSLPHSGQKTSNVGSPTPSTISSSGSPNFQ